MQMLFYQLSVPFFEVKLEDSEERLCLSDDMETWNVEARATCRLGCFKCAQRKPRETRRFQCNRKRLKREEECGSIQALPWVHVPTTNSANFRRLVLFCIKADFCVQIRIFQHFSIPTRFVNLCTAPNSKFADFLHFLNNFFWRIFEIFVKFCNFLG